MGRPQHKMTLSLCLDLRPWEGPLLFLHCPLWPPEPYETQQAEPMSFLRGLRLVMSHGPYIKLIAGFLFTSLAFMVSGGLTCSIGGGGVHWEGAGRGLMM